MFAFLVTSWAFATPLKLKSRAGIACIWVELAASSSMLGSIRLNCSSSYALISPLFASDSCLVCETPGYDLLLGEELARSGETSCCVILSGALRLKLPSLLLFLLIDNERKTFSEKVGRVVSLLLLSAFSELVPVFSSSYSTPKRLS